MKLKFMLSLSALVIVALVMLGSAEYIHAHPNAYPQEMREGHRFNVQRE